MADKEVRVFAENDIAISASNEETICFFCNHQFSKYTCPRCNSSYCSITCYKSKKHLSCSEGFYKESIVQELTSRSKDPKDVANVLRMLKTLEEEDLKQDLEDSNDLSLEERLANIDLDNADVIWEALTLDERRDFETTLESGNVSHLIEEWVPWWQQKKCGQISGKTKIQVMTSGANQTNGTAEQDIEANSKPTQKPGYPKVLQKIPLVTGSANPLIKYSIVDVLYAYAYVMRLYNGCPEENLNQSVLTLFKLSSSLSKNKNFESLETVVHNSLNVVLDNKDVWNSQEFSYSVLLDVSNLLSGNYTVSARTIAFADCALSEVHRLLAKCKKALTGEIESEKEDAKQLWLAKKKVEFFLSWTQSNSHVLCSFVPGLKTLHFELISNRKIHEDEKRKLQEKWKGNKVVSCKKLVEEL